jgi:hypothetical protein
VRQSARDRSTKATKPVTPRSSDTSAQSGTTPTKNSTAEDV